MKLGLWSDSCGLLALSEALSLVLGGEASPEVEALLSLAAATGARRHWQSMGSTDEAAACGTLAWLLRRRWGITALRENARLKLERLEFVGRGAITAMARRAVAASSMAARSRAAAVMSFTRGPRSRGLAV